MKKKTLGIISLTCVSIFILLIILLRIEGEFFSASNVKLVLVFFAASIVTSGLYAIKNKLKKPLLKFGLPIFGITLIVFAGLISFNIIPFIETYNWLISAGILYVLFIQLQLLNWGNNAKLFPKIASFIIILANGFLVVFFIAKWAYAGLSMVIDTVTLTAVFVFLIGYIASRKMSSPEADSETHQQ